jgi:hypothetical protein
MEKGAAKMDSESLSVTEVCLCKAFHNSDKKQWKLIESFILY